MRRLLNDLRRGLASPNRNARSAVVLGRLLGVTFLICFGTGLYSHFLQDPLPWMHFPTHPRQLYQFTQGLHITAGIAIIPLLFAKLNTVMPSLVQTPPVRGVLHGLERASIALFVSAAIVQVMTGLVNTYQWYPWPFPFRQTHYALSYVLIGSLAIHIGAKLRIIVRYWRARDAYDEHGRFVVDPSVGSEIPVPPESSAVWSDPTSGATATPARGITGRVMRWIDGAADAVEGEPRPTTDRTFADHATSRPTARTGAERRAEQRAFLADRPGTPDVDAAIPDPSTEIAAGRRDRIARRGFFAGVTAAVAAVVVLTVGQSNALGVPFNVFAPRQRGRGPNHLPINRTAKAAGVLTSAADPSWGLTVQANGIRKRFSREDLRSMGLVGADLPISCVEGWSQMASWRGVRLRDLIGELGAPPASRLRVTSLEQHGGYRIMEMGPEYTSDPTTLVALELNGEDLDIDHGYPARIIAPGRPGVLQTKWLASIEVLS